MHINVKAVLIAFTLPICAIHAEDREPPPAAPAAPAARSDQSASGGKTAEIKTGETDAENPMNRGAQPMSKTEETIMKRVTGIGGVFIKAKDPDKLRAWYKTHLGIDVQTWGGAAFTGVPAKAKTAWFVGDGSDFEPSNSSFMINYRVADLRGLLRLLREESCQVLDKVEESDYGIFGWVMDPEGNKVELWQPPAGE